MGPRGEGVGERDRGSIMWEDEGKNGGTPCKEGARKAKRINYAIFCRPAISISPHPTQPHPVVAHLSHGNRRRHYHY